jgi:hypothetical protein
VTGHSETAPDVVTADASSAARGKCAHSDESDAEADVKASVEAAAAMASASACESTDVGDDVGSSKSGSEHHAKGGRWLSWAMVSEGVEFSTVQRL